MESLWECDKCQIKFTVHGENPRPDNGMREREDIKHCPFCGNDELKKLKREPILHR